jgi:hypothetical protein
LLLEHKGGRYDPVALELKAEVNVDWAFHIAMFIFLFSTTILMLNVLIGKPFSAVRFDVSLDKYVYF